jgi:hypothetical protein
VCGGIHRLYDEVMAQTNKRVAKDAAKKTLESSPDLATVEGLLIAPNVLAKIDRSERQIRKGKAVPHEQVKRSLRKWRK